jgi:23S rRNA (adenine2503-C2)-methyltransferase
LSAALPNLKDFGPEALRRRLGAEGLPAYRADQISAWLYGRGVDDLDAMTDLGADLRRWLAERFETRALHVARVDRSSDGTVKAVLRAEDDALVEAVLIPEEERTTLCVSTQVGCPLACSFCATGALGFRRNLRTAEIVDQVCRMRELLAGDRRITNVVFMGMGEPLLNLRNVVEAVRILQHPKAFGFAPRRITVSTAGLVPKIPALLEQVQVNLAVSLHASTDAVRDELVPLNRRYPLEVLLGTLRAVPSLSRRRPVFFEYTLMEGVNDAPEDARRLVRILGGIPSKVNLIPMNAHADAPYRPPAQEVASRFMGELVRGGLTTTLRRSRGADIDAACGQLALREAAPGAGGAASCRAPVPPMSRPGHAVRGR